jgi:hypothetical protein
MPPAYVENIRNHCPKAEARQDRLFFENAETIPLAGIMFYGPLLSAALWLVIGLVAWALFF